MEDILELYAEPYDPRYPVLCFDETPCQLIEETQKSMLMEPGKRERYDYEYKRNGVVNIFLFVQPLLGWRELKVTQRKTRIDFAQCVVDLANHFPSAEKIRLVLDNLNTHSPGTLYEILHPKEARRIIKKLEFRNTPKHASWLNMAEIEFSVLNRQCLDNRRLGTINIVEKEVIAWKDERNSKKAQIDWMFDIDKAREKMGSLYPKLWEATINQAHQEAH